MPPQNIAALTHYPGSAASLIQGSFSLVEAPVATSLQPCASSEIHESVWGVGFVFFFAGGSDMTGVNTDEGRLVPAVRPRLEESLKKSFKLTVCRMKKKWKLLGFRAAMYRETGVLSQQWRMTWKKRTVRRRRRLVWGYFWWTERKVRMRRTSQHLRVSAPPASAGPPNHSTRP